MLTSIVRDGRIATHTPLLMPISLSPDELMPFPTYRTARIDARHGFEGMSPELAPSVEHFFQSERFRGTDETLRRAILDANSAKEARKLAARKSAAERPNWTTLQERVMEAGLWMKLREHPHYAQILARRPETAQDSYPYRDHFWGGHREGVSENRYRDLLLRMRDKLLARKMVRVAITGSSTFSNEFLLSSKLDVLFRRLPPDLVLIGCRKGADDLAERWAIEQALPVRHIPYRGRRSSSERERHARALLGRATHVVAFSDGDSETELIKQIAKQFGCSTRILPTTSRPNTARPATLSGPTPMRPSRA